MCCAILFDDNMARNGYTGISIPEPLAKQIDSFIETNTHGYTSKGDFLKDAARKLLNYYNNNGGNGAFSTTNSDPISPPTQKNGEKRS